MPREVILLRDAADIRRAALRVATRWRPPRIEVSTGRFPVLAAQYAQQRFTRLANDCNCLLGEVLGGTTLVLGLGWGWVFNRSWSDVGLVLVAALLTLFTGKIIERAWTRARMLLVLLGLRRRLDSTKDLRATKPVGHEWLEAPHAPLNESSAAGADQPMAQAPMRRRRPRPRVILNNAADVRRLCVRLATRWTLPRIEIRNTALLERDAQRAQHRYMRLTDGSSFMLAAVLGTLTLLAGSLYVILTQTPDVSPIEEPELWARAIDWSDVQPVLLATSGAALAGWVIERLVIRLRLLRVLRVLGQRIAASG